MFKKIITGIAVIISIISAIVVAGIPDVVNWWELTKPWVVSFFTSILFALIVNNGDLIRRYTYPTYVCILAWAYGHKLLNTKLGKQSHIVYTKNNKSYSKLFEVTQCLYDMVVLES